MLIEITPFDVVKYELDKVWGYEYAGDSRTVDVHIRWLREKVEDEPANPRHIKTVRGIGYRLEIAN